MGGRTPRSAGEECVKVTDRESVNRKGRLEEGKEIGTDRWNYSTNRAAACWLRACVCACVFWGGGG